MCIYEFRFLCVSLLYNFDLYTVRHLNKKLVEKQFRCCLSPSTCTTELLSFPNNAADRKCMLSCVCTQNKTKQNTQTSTQTLE